MLQSIRSQRIGDELATKPPQSPTHPGLWRLTFWVGTHVPIAITREAFNKLLNLSLSQSYL